MANSLKLYEVH